MHTCARRWQRCISIALLLCAVVGGLTACDAPPPPKAYVDTGARFPELQLTNLKGEPVSTAQFAGKVLVLNVWATWCAPCRKELPSLQRLSDQLDPQHFAVIGMSVDADVHVVREFLIERKVTFTNWQDADMQVAREVLGARAYPSTYLISADGVVRRVVGGAQPWDNAEWLNLIRSIADQPKQRDGKL